MPRPCQESSTIPHRKRQPEPSDIRRHPPSNTLKPLYVTSCHLICAELLAKREAALWADWKRLPGLTSFMQIPKMAQKIQILILLIIKTVMNLRHTSSKFKHMYTNRLTKVITCNSSDRKYRAEYHHGYLQILRLILILNRYEITCTVIPSIRSSAVLLKHVDLFCHLGPCNIRGHVWLHCAEKYPGSVPFVAYGLLFVVHEATYLRAKRDRDFSRSPSRVPENNASRCNCHIS